MKFKKLNGLEVYKNIEKYRIDWDKISCSKPQFHVKQFLKKYWFYDMVYEECYIVGTKLRLDFLNYSRKIAIEVSPEQHFKFSPFFHNNSRAEFFRSIQRDGKKRKWCEINNIILVEILQDEIFKLSPELFLQNFNITL